MIYFFYGSDTKAKIKIREDISRSFDAGSIFEMNDLNFDFERFKNLAESNSLFGAKSLLILDNVLENEEAEPLILKHLDVMKGSDNTFLFIEKKALKDIVNKFGKYSEKVEDLRLDKKKEYKADVFAITRPLEKRDKKGMWLEFQKIKDQTESEAISGILFWKIKDMILKGNNRNYTETELKNLSSKLISLHHDAHRGLIDFKTGLEKFIIDSL